MTKEIVEGGFFSNRPELRADIKRIKFPTRTRKSPSGSTDQVWVNGITSRWTEFRDAAIDWLSMGGPTEIDLLRIDEKSLNEEFIISKPAIRKDVLKMRRSEDVRDVYRYFSFGREVAKNEAGEVVVNITRKELLQLYTVVFARKYLLRQRREGFVPDVRRDRTELSGNLNKSADADEESLFGYLDKVMRQRPEHGGPLFSK